MKLEARSSKFETPRRSALLSSLGVGRWALSVGRFSSGFSVGRFPSVVMLMILLLLMINPASAQTISLQTGQKIETQGVRRDGDMVMGKVQIGTGSGEVGYHLAQIAKVEFPEPRALKVAS